MLLHQHTKAISFPCHTKLTFSLTKNSVLPAYSITSCPHFIYIFIVSTFTHHLFIPNYAPVPCLRLISLLKSFFFNLWLVPDAPPLLADVSMNIGRPSRRSSFWDTWIYYCQLWDYESIFNTISLSFPFHRRLTPVWTSDITRREWLRLQLNHFRLFADVAKIAKQAYLWITHKTSWRALSPLWRAPGLITSYVMT